MEEEKNDEKHVYTIKCFTNELQALFEKYSAEVDEDFFNKAMFAFVVKEMMKKKSPADTMLESMGLLVSVFFRIRELLLESVKEQK